MPVRKLYTRRNILTVALLAIVIALAYAAGQAIARPAATPKPIPAPAELLEARFRCPNTASVIECRGELRKALQAVSWQRKARLKAKATTVREITLDAIAWAAARYGVSATEMRTVANCESHLWPFATNGQYLGVFQLGATHRTDPIFDQVPWMDAYAQASHVARFIKAHGWSQWQCSPRGGLQW